MLSIDKRVSGLHPDEVRRLHGAVCAAEEALLFAPGSAGPDTEPLRERACELSAELLSTLGKLERRLRDGGQCEARESHADWIARQGAPSGVTHAPKVNGRTAKPTEPRIAHAA